MTPLPFGTAKTRGGRIGEKREKGRKRWSRGRRKKKNCIPLYHGGVGEEKFGCKTYE